MYEKRKPLTENEINDFKVEYNHNRGLLIKDGTDTYEDGDLTFESEFIFALEPNEIMGQVEAEIDVSNKVEEGQEQTYHKETVTLYKPVINPNWEDIELERAKVQKIKENDSARDAALNGGVEYKGILFDSDTDQKVNLLAVVSTMGDEETITWYGMNNDSLECTKADLINIGGLITQLHSECWYRNACYKYAINAAETLEELEAIVIDYEGDFFRRVDDENTANIEL